MTSLRQRLLAWLIALLTVVAVFAGAVEYWLDREEMDESLDNQLKLIAWSISSNAMPAPVFGIDGEARDPEDEFIITVWGGAGVRNASNSAVALPEPNVAGFENFRANGEEWRSYALVDGLRKVQVAQRMIVRRELAASSAVKAVLPIAALIPLSWLLVGWVVDRVLAPLDAVAQELRFWGKGRGGPLSLNNIPDEVLPLARATNDLISKLHGQIEFRRAFISDAAHEMRTPLAALRLQARNLRSNATDADRLGLVEEMDQGIRRLASMVSQMLKLAKADEPTTAREAKLICLSAAITSSIQGVLPLALNKGIEIGASSSLDGEIFGDEDDFRTLLDNLLDNAVRYTPRGGTVDVGLSAAQGRPVLQVTDTGPGISEHLLERVFDRFFRVAGSDVQGSGLGLSIVRTMAEHLGASVSLQNRADRSGLVARISFPTPV